MSPTLFVAVLAHPDLPGEVLTANGQPHPGAPILLTVSATRQQAERNLIEAARAEWDRERGMRLGLGPSSEWPDDARLLRRMRDEGYLATVTEQAVDL